eukprot:5649954-Pleurochrysis_carterae.AAC.1
MLLSIRLLAIAFAVSTRMSAHFTGAPEVDEECKGLDSLLKRNVAPSGSILLSSQQRFFLE